MFAFEISEKICFFAVFLAFLRKSFMISKKIFTQMF